MNPSAIRYKALELIFPSSSWADVGRGRWLLGAKWQAGRKEGDKGILRKSGPRVFMVSKDDTTMGTLTAFCLSLFFFFWYAIWILRTEEQENPVSTKFYIHYPSKRPRNQIYWYCLCLPNEPFEILKWHQYRFLEELTDINSPAKSELQTSEHLSYLESSIFFLSFLWSWRKEIWTTVSTRGKKANRHQSWSQASRCIVCFRYYVIY